MPDKPLPVEPGDRPSAEHHNLTDDAAFRDFSGGAPGFDFPDGFGVRNEENYPEPYAKAQSDWEDNSADPKVSVKMCDRDGSNPRGAAFDVYLPRRRATDTATQPIDDFNPDIFEDDVIRWEYDNDGRRVCVSEYLHSIPWAVAQSDWNENGAATPRVIVKACDSDGSNPRGPNFFVYLPRKRAASIGYDPDVYAADLIRWDWDHDRNRDPKSLRVCITPYLSSKIGDIRSQAENTRIQTGWLECIYANRLTVRNIGHRVAMGRETENPEANEDAAGETGGFRWHGADGPGEADNNHPDHSIESLQGDDNLDASIGEFLHGENEPDPTILKHLGPFNIDSVGQDTDNRMPFMVVIKIQRYK